MENGSQDSGASRKRHEDRAIRCLAAFVGSDGAHEVGVPRTAARIDAVWNVGELHGALGPLEPYMRHRVVGVEAYGGAVPRGALADAAFKAGWLAKSWWRTDPGRRHGTRPPLMLLVSNRRLTDGLVDGSFQAVSPGISHLRVGTELEFVVVQLDAVPVGIGTTGLHMLRTPSDDADGRALAAFLSDTSVTPELRSRVRADIMNGTIPGTETERMTAHDRVMAEGIAIGERRGQRHGETLAREQARQALLAQARTVLGDAAADELSRIQDFGAMCARAFEMLQTPPPAP